MDEPIRVLHVDDDADLAELAAIRLERADERLSVETASRVSEARDQLDGVDCVVSDYDMPERNGIEFLDIVRAKHPDLPFILFTGKGSEEIASEAISAGVTDYLQKQGGVEQYELLANRIVNAVSKRRARTQVIETEQRLRELSKATDDVLWMVKRDWSEFLFVNPAYNEMWGRSRERLDDDPVDFLRGVHPDDRDKVMDTMDALSNGEATDVEFRVNEEESFERWVWAKGEPITADGDVVRIAGFVRDVTDRKAQERRIRETKRRFQKVAETASDAILIIDADSVIHFANPAVEETFGYAPEEVVGESLTMLMPERFRDEHAAAVREYVETGERSLDWTDVELPGLHREGREIDLRISFAEFEHEGERRFTGIAHDITERKRHERELEEKTERLEEFASIVSHDLRNPLSVAMGRVDLARAETDNEHLDMAATALDRMEALIGDVLALAREGERVVNVEPVELGPTCEQCWQNVETANATLAVERDWAIRADRSRLQQLLENLFRNAVEHGGEGVTVTVDMLDEEQGFYVADDGPGVPADSREKVFESGYSTTRYGTGFGLAIVSEITNAHGWSTRVTESEEGGARFEIAGVEPAGE